MSDDGDLQREVRCLREEVDALRRRLDALEESDGVGAARPSGDRRGRPAAREVPAERDESAEPDGPEEPAEPVESSTGTAEGPVATDDGTDGGSSGGVAVDGRDWELAVGIRWLGLAGALALVVGVVFFVRLAIEMGLLGPLGRVAVGALGGLLLFGGGRHAVERRGYVRWGRIAAGTGLAVAYFSLYAAYGFESYREAIGTPLWAALVGLTLLVAGTAVLSVRDGAPLVVGEAFLLGYVTAVLSTDAATLVVTPAYVLLLAGGLVAIARVKPWSGLVVASTFATYIVVGLWRADLDPPPAALGAVVAAAFSIYLAGGYVLRRSDRAGEWDYRTQLAVLTAANAVFAAALLEGTIRGAAPDAAVEGVGTATVAVALAGAYALADRRGAPRDPAAAAGSIVLLAAAIWMAAGPFATTVGALALICGGVGLARAGDAPGFRLGAHVVAAALVPKLLAVDAVELPAFDAAAPVATLTGRPVAFALAVGAFYALARTLAAEPSLTGYERGDRLSVAGAYAAAATGLAVIALGLELSGLGTSVAWALFGLALLGVGLALDARGVRALGVAVLGLATAKVFLYDTSDLDAVARTLSFLVVGAVLLAASYVYARLQGDVRVDIGLRERGEG